MENGGKMERWEDRKNFNFLVGSGKVEEWKK